MSDPLMFLHHDKDAVECDVCEAINNVVVTTHTRTGEWVRESFTCPCGEHHGEIDGRRDNGHVDVWFSLIVASIACTAIALLGSCWWLAAVGAWSTVAITSIAFFKGADNRNGTNHD